MAGIKFFVIGKRKKRLITSIILIIMLTATLYSIKARGDERKISSPLENRVILIDPGHGGVDSGASVGDVLEKELNLKIAYILQAYIEESGGVAILTRVDDSSTADPNRIEKITQKLSDLKERKKDIDDFEADMFISIHMNKFSQSKYRGAQVFYTDKSEKSKRLGEILQQTVKEVLDNNNTRTAKPSGSGIYVLKGNSVPSALVECGFLSNPQEAEELQQKEYQRKIAWAIYLGIVRYFSC